MIGFGGVMVFVGELGVGGWRGDGGGGSVIERGGVFWMVYDEGL